MSDFEFAIFTTQKISSQERLRLQYRLLDLTASIPHTNPQFHIDWVLIPHSEAPKLKHTLALFEMKTLGKSLVGDEQDLDRLPEVNVSTIDIGTLDQLVLVRLWWLLAGIPKRIVSGSSSRYERLLFQYVSCRNFLDIPTILLPHEGYLIPGYEARSLFLRQNAHKLPSVRYMDEQFPAVITTALDEKRRVAFRLSEIQQYSQTVDGYTRLVRFLLKVQPDLPITNLCDVLSEPRSSFDSHIASRQRVRRFLKSSNRWIKNPSISGMKHLVQATESRLIATILSLHLALINILLESELEASRWLSNTRNHLETILPLVSHPTNSFPEEWLYLRAIVAQAMYDTFSTIDRRRIFTEELLEWTSNGCIIHD